MTGAVGRGAVAALLLAGAVARAADPPDAGAGDERARPDAGTPERRRERAARGADDDVIERLDLLERLELLQNLELFDPEPPRRDEPRDGGG